MKENRFIVISVIVLFCLILTFFAFVTVFGRGVAHGRRQIEDWNITEKHRSLELSHHYNYCPYCGESLREVEE